MRGLIGIGVLCLVVAALAMPGIAVPANSLQPQLTFPEIVERLNSVNPTLKSLIVDQNALVHWMGVFHFLLRTTVYAARPALYKVIVHEAPAILRPLGDSFYLASSPEQVLANYRATSIRQSADGMLVMELIATQAAVNPPSGAVVIDTNRWLVQELTLNYKWGQLKAQYHYGEVEGFLLPDTISVSLPRFPISAELTYRNYQLNAPIDPAVFGQAPVLPDPPP